MNIKQVINKYVKDRDGFEVITGRPTFEDRTEFRLKVLEDKIAKLEKQIIDSAKAAHQLSYYKD